MKAFLSILLLGISVLSLSAQTDTLAPKWEKGRSWKVSSKSYMPDTDLLKEENIVKYDTVIIDYIWTVENIDASVVTLSILPQKYYSSSVVPGEEVDFLKNAIEKIKAENIPLLYQTDLHGKLKRIENDGEFSLLSNKYFVNDSVFKRLFPVKEYVENEEEAIFWDEEKDVLKEVPAEIPAADTLASEEAIEATYEEEIPEDGNEAAAGYGYWFLLETFGKIIDLTHTMYGEPLIIDSLVDFSAYSEEKLNAYQEGLGAMAKMMDIKGHSKFTQQKNQLICDYEVTLDMASFITSMMNSLKELGDEEGTGEKKKSKKEKKESAEKEKKEADDLSQMSMMIKVNGHLIMEGTSYFPVRISTIANSSGSFKEETMDLTGYHELIFE